MEQTGLFITLGGLLIFTLMLASLVRQYQERMAEKRLRIQRIMRGVDVIEDLLKRGAGCNLSAEIERVLREDVLARLQLIRQIDGRFRGIAELVVEAQRAVAQLPREQAQTLQDKQQLQRNTAALGELMGFLQQGRLLKPLAGELLRSYVEQVGTRRAECVYRFHMRQAEQLRQADQLQAALGHCNSVKAFLNENGPANEQVKAWYAEAEELRKELSAAAAE